MSPKQHKIFRLPEPLVQALKIAALAHGTTETTYITNALVERLAREKSQVIKGLIQKAQAARPH